MLYITEVHKNSSGLWYTICDTHTNSDMIAKPEFVSKIITKLGMEIKNAALVNNKVQLKQWPNKIKTYIEYEPSGCDSILISKLSEDRFKIVSSTERFKIITADELKDRIILHNVANCSFKNENGNTIYQSMDTTEANEDKEFTQNINQKYKEFIAKCKMLGLDMQFEYEVEGEEIRITKYRGTSKKVTIPGFVTSIGYAAFHSEKIEELVLKEGLKHIGNNAFSYNKIRQVNIPDSVETYWDGAFDGNLALFYKGEIKISESTKIMPKEGSRL